MREIVKVTQRELDYGGSWLFMSAHPDMVRDDADGEGRVSGQKKIFRHFFSQSHRTKRVQITENHLPLCPV